MPSTNVRIFASVILEVLFVLVILGGMLMGRTFPIEIVSALGTFITAWLGIDVAQFKFKRDSFVPIATPRPPAPPTTLAPRKPGA